MLYSFEVPGFIIWISHISIGIFLMYVGYMLLNNQSVNQMTTLIVMMLGVLALAYHSHLMYVNWNK